ncbi:bifunctional 5,10-methylenetetrahydrofolate dehydrogenase/5,10-methenyltetrahydrofolate cyclohydrolase [Gammaproteobacteria bacterium]|nr:bifunctional 5,10-methylenetetrahydrofolate dehydrogenase/5,10-methenyltetrahydrofolate cyclohydrolase [Gammaproteobacteria bacterium]
MKYTEKGTLILDGRFVAQEMQKSIKEKIDNSGVVITLATVLVGDDKPSQLYVNNKHKQATASSIKSMHVNLPGNISQAELEDKISQLGNDPSVNGILIQMPLPKGLNEDSVIEMIPTNKDVDGLKEQNLGKLIVGNDVLRPCTPLGVMKLIEYYKLETAGKKALVIGRSRLVGMPQVIMFGSKGIDCTVTLAHSRTKNLDELISESEIVVPAIGVPGIINAKNVRKDSILLDVGISSDENGIHGDVDFNSVDGIAKAVTPMPGGTGPMTVASLLENTMKAAQLQGIIQI